MNTPPTIALVTAHAARGTDPDMQPLLLALRAAGALATEVDWDDASVAWSGFDIALLRSTWDYVQRLPEFLAWAQAVSLQTRLLNPLDVIRWNTDKHYLADLQGAGVACVPTAFLEPGDAAATIIEQTLLAHPQAQDFVLKPVIGAGSRDAQRHARAARAAMLAHAQGLLRAGRGVMLQPYLEHVDSHGETSLLYFDGVYSHAIRKGPLLRRGDAATSKLYAEETISPRAASADELQLGARALAALRCEQAPLYARVDVLRDQCGTPRLLELELVEPSVFLEHAEVATANFVAAILRRCASA